MTQEKLREELATVADEAKFRMIQQSNSFNEVLPVPNSAGASVELACLGHVLDLSFGLSKEA